MKFEPTYEQKQKGEHADAVSHLKARIKHVAEGEEDSIKPFHRGDIVSIEGETGDGRRYCVGTRGAAWLSLEVLESHEE